MEFGLSEWIGLFVAIAVIWSMQLKNVKYILLCQLVCNGLGALSYITGGNLSGCGLYVVAVVQTVVFFLYRQKNPDKTSFWLTGLFVLLYATCSALTYRMPQDLLSATAGVFAALALSQKKASAYRLLLLVNGMLWIVYDVTVFAAVTMLVSHILTTASAVVGIVRLDLRKGKRGV